MDRLDEVKKVLEKLAQQQVELAVLVSQLTEAVRRGDQANEPGWRPENVRVSQAVRLSAVERGCLNVKKALEEGRESVLFAIASLY